MLKTVYIIVDGMDDDRHICAVFSSRQAAEAALCYGDEGATIEEFQVDAPLPDGPPGHSNWNVSEYNGYTTIRLSAFRYPQEEQVELDSDEYSVEVWARTEREARRLGAERIKRFKAGQGA